MPGGTWAAGGSLNTARGYHGGAGLQTAAIVFGGTDGTPLVHLQNLMMDQVLD